MSENVQHCFKLLSIISQIKDLRTKKHLLKKSYCEPMYQALREVAFNIRAKNINLGAREKRKLKKYSPVFMKMLDKNNSHRKKKLLYQQAGGALGLLIPLVVSAL